MKIKVYQEYEGELDEKKEDLVKALFPNVRNIEESLNLPERKLREPAAQQMLEKMDKEYKKMLDRMYDEIEAVLIKNRGK